MIHINPEGLSYGIRSKDGTKPMFTGIIEAIGTVETLEKRDASGRIKIRCPLAPDVLKQGGSVSVNGSCLTVIDFVGGVFSADVSSETLLHTTFGSLKKGSSVNLETPLTLNKPLGGHIVTGHVDCKGKIMTRQDTDAFSTFEISVERTFFRFLVHKGSVAIDGISLTIAELIEDGFTTAVIPHTLKSTTLSARKPGDEVNIETDIIGKYVERFTTGNIGKGVTEGFLREHGFMGGKGN
ncbi:MAG: riboflavin synthase [Thermodesulfobacteriota bacterium]